MAANSPSSTGSNVNRRAWHREVATTSQNERVAAELELAATEPPTCWPKPSGPAAGSTS